MIRIISLSIVLATIAPQLAHADDEVRDEGAPAPVAPHVNFGVDLMGGSETASVVGRFHVGMDTAFGRGHVRPSIGLGITFGAGILEVGDPRALTGSLSIGYRDYGPELQLGMRWVDGGVVDTRLFASFAFVRTDIDQRLMLDTVEGVGGRFGARATLGLNWADHVPDWIRNSTKGPCIDHCHSTDGFEWLGILIPDQAEVGWERSAGSDRYGVTLSWGI
jgi:hypothetical protein